MTAAEISVCAARVIHADASTLLFRGQTRLNNIVYRDCILDGASLVFRRRELELIAVIVVSSISSLSSINGGRGSIQATARSFAPVKGCAARVKAQLGVSNLKTFKFHKYPTKR